MDVVTCSEIFVPLHIIIHMVTMFSAPNIHNMICKSATLILAGKDITLERWWFHFSPVLAAWLVPSSFSAILLELKNVIPISKITFHYTSILNMRARKTVGNVEINSWNISFLYSQWKGLSLAQILVYWFLIFAY